jgi:hypothetical protein
VRGKRFGDAPPRLRRQARIRVQEKERVSRGHRGTGVHLHRAPARRRDHPVGERRGELHGGVGAAAVRHDHFVAARAQRRERAEAALDPRGLVQRRDDDGKALSDQS